MAIETVTLMVGTSWTLLSAAAAGPFEAQVRGPLPEVAFFFGSTAPAADYEFGLSRASLRYEALAAKVWARAREPVAVTCTRTVDAGNTAEVMLPALTLSAASFAADVAAGAEIATITGRIAGDKIDRLLPGDGRLVLNSDGTKIVRGLSAVSPGTIEVEVVSSHPAAPNSPRRTKLTLPVTQGAPQLPATALRGLIDAVADGSVGQAYSAPTGWTDVQWYRRSFVAGAMPTRIDGAAGPTYVATLADVRCELWAVGKDGGVVKAAASIHVIQLAPVPVEDYADISAWAIANGVKSLDADRKILPGRPGALKIQSNSSASGVSADKTTAHVIDPVAMADHLLAVYGNHGNSLNDVVQSSSPGIRFATTGTLTATTLFDAGPVFNNIRRGWWTAGRIGSYGPTSGGLAAQGTGPLKIKHAPSSLAPYANVMTCGAVVRCPDRMTYVCLGLDDADETQITNALPIHLEFDIPVTAYLPTGNIGQPGRWSEAATLYAYGTGKVNILIDGSENDSIVNQNPGGRSAALAGIANMQNWVTARGMPKPDGLCWPNGSYGGGVTTRIQLSGISSTANSPVITSATALDAAIVAGGEVKTFGVPDGTTVLSRDSDTQLTLSNPVAVTSSAKTVSVTYTDRAANGFGGLAILDDLPGLGIVSARITQGLSYNAGTGVVTGGENFPRFGVGGRNYLVPAESSTQETFEEFKAKLDYCIARGLSPEWYHHGVVSGSTSNLDTDPALYRQKVAYVRNRQDAGACKAITVAERNRMTKNAYCPV